MRRSGLIYFVAGVVVVVIAVQLVWWVLTPLYDMLWRSIAWVILAIGMLPVWAFLSSGIQQLRSRWSRPTDDKPPRPVDSADHAASPAPVVRQRNTDRHRNTDPHRNADPNDTSDRSSLDG